VRVRATRTKGRWSGAGKQAKQKWLGAWRWQAQGGGRAGATARHEDDRTENGGEEDLLVVQEAG